MPESPRPSRPAAPGVPAIAPAFAGRYEVRGILGEGGTGVVYDAVRISDGEAVALKVMHANLAGEAQIRGRFQREAAILRRLEGPNICPILELGEIATGAGGQTLLYIALPKLAGSTLADVLEEERPIDVERGLDVMLEVCAALRTAHAQGVIHRDLKPANVLLAGGDKVVVVDFGMSKIITGAGTGTTNLTAHNMLFGTPEYMSPEQARGDELDARCDVYSAGVMLYEMLTGAPPFTGPTPLGVLTEHLTGVIVPPQERAAPGRVSKALGSVVMHALARDREQRYPSASALAAAIVHARSLPDDVISLRPDAFTTSAEGALELAMTMPALGPPAPERSSPKAVVSGAGDLRATAGAATDATLPATAGSSPPRATPAKGARPKSSSPPVAPVVPRIASEETSRTWILLWVLAAVASIGAGVWFALR